MLEEIKKEILEKLLPIVHLYEDKSSSIYYNRDDLFEILDKYADKIYELKTPDNCGYVEIPKLSPDYKAMWEELKELHLKTREDLAHQVINEIDVFVYSQMLKLEQKHGIGDE